MKTNGQSLRLQDTIGTHKRLEKPSYYPPSKAGSIFKIRFRILRTSLSMEPEYGTKRSAL